jgi:hypothetical protein
MYNRTSAIDLTDTGLTIIISRCINAHDNLYFCKAMTGIVRDKHHHREGIPVFPALKDPGCSYPEYHP